MAKQKEYTYYSIRVVTAKNKKEAIRKVQSEGFNENHPLCDSILTARQFHRALKD